MLLFIDRLPFHAWTPYGTPQTLQSVCVPVLLTDPGHPPPPPRVRPQRWAIDTRFTGEAFAWRQHLLEAGLDPDANRLGHTRLMPLGNTPQPFPLRRADLWLVSNIPALQATPWRVGVSEGIAVHDAPHIANPDVNSPLLGMRVLLRAGLHVHLDFARATVSVWVPAPWPRRLAVTTRRCLTGFRTLPVRW